ncbi:hypothetical protein [Candidatus Bathycorpusculum sp.]|uniref:hypothetical protein n=1 Tax=Candidatus Bathycorpusculum sp. TaxID=2994959 RepID=UPI00282FC327|nr:hypothetical protein [Candidatus Termitimicrobium sp.]MCL2432673.1 hypothetical protein [Candidatus Termitimicrobium sp.]
MSQISCDKKNCVNNKNGFCSRANPEKEGDSCIDYEDEMDFTRLKADTIRGTLG